MKPRHIKIFWRIVFALSLLTALAASLPFLWPRLFPSLYATDAYRTYADRPGIDATCLHNFPLDDTLTIDVTILQATDSLGWETLKKDFNVKDFPPEVLSMTDSTSVSFKYAPKGDYSLPQDTVLLNNDVIVFSRHKHEILVFDIQNETQIDKLLSYRINNLKTKKQ